MFTTRYCCHTLLYIYYNHIYKIYMYCTNLKVMAIRFTMLFRKFYGGWVTSVSTLDLVDIERYVYLYSYWMFTQLHNVHYLAIYDHKRYNRTSPTLLLNTDYLDQLLKLFIFLQNRSKYMYFVSSQNNWITHKTKSVWFSEITYIIWIFLLHIIHVQFK